MATKPEPEQSDVTDQQTTVLRAGGIVSGAAGGAIAGTALAGPPGAAVGAVVGATLGGALNFGIEAALAAQGIDDPKAEDEDQERTARPA
ncbi:MAG TPA: hypothetical protein VGW38_02440 [Chloroflexota bacterium]|nr:hypothetical protein [Chloroflexota bacterium]